MKVLELVPAGDAPDQLHRVRRETVKLATRLGFDADECEAIKLAVCELATNAILYSGGGVVLFWVLAGKLVVCVVDAQQEKRDLTRLRENADLVCTNVAVGMKRLPGSLASDKQPGCPGLPSEVRDELCAWTPADDRGRLSGQRVVECWDEGGERVVLAFGALDEVAPPDLLAEHGRGHMLAEALMDAYGVGVLAYLPGKVAA